MHTSAQADQTDDGFDTLAATLNARYEQLARAAEAAHDEYLSLNTTPLIETDK